MVPKTTKWEVWIVPHSYNILLPFGMLLFGMLISGNIF
jgi:hypothetical protein